MQKQVVNLRNASVAHHLRNVVVDNNQNKHARRYVKTYVRHESVMRDCLLSVQCAFRHSPGRELVTELSV